MILGAAASDSGLASRQLVVLCGGHSLARTTDPLSGCALFQIPRCSGLMLSSVLWVLQSATEARSTPCVWPLRWCGLFRLWASHTGSACPGVLPCGRRLSSRACSPVLSVRRSFFGEAGVRGTPVDWPACLVLSAGLEVLSSVPRLPCWAESGLVPRSGPSSVSPKRTDVF